MDIRGSAVNEIFDMPVSVLCDLDGLIICALKLSVISVFGSKTALGISKKVMPSGILIKPARQIEGFSTFCNCVPLFIDVIPFPESNNGQCKFHSRRPVCGICFLKQLVEMTLAVGF